MTATAKKITRATLPDLICQDGRSETFHWDPDLPGFGVRALATGKRVWVVQYRNRAGQTRRSTLGDLRVVSPEEARSAARDTLAAAQLGGDPQAEARAARASLTAREYFDAYLAARKDAMRPRSFTEAERALTKHAKPLHFTKIDAVTRRDVVDVLDKVMTNSGGTAANRLRAHLSACWAWGIKTGRIEGANPVAATLKPAREISRDRVLTDMELSLIWRATDRPTTYNRIVRLLMLTAARREEVAAVEWSELNVAPNAGTWALPASRSKNGRAHELPLTPLAIQQLPGLDGSAGLIFGARNTPFSGWSQSKQRLDARMQDILNGDFEKVYGRPPTQDEVLLASWRLHDLRRTFATWANENGHEPHVVEAVLNHISGTRNGVAGIYNRATYRDQKKKVLSDWSDHVDGLLHGGAAAERAGAA